MKNSTTYIRDIIRDTIGIFIPNQDFDVMFPLLGLDTIDLEELSQQLKIDSGFLQSTAGNTIHKLSKHLLSTK